IDGSIAIQSPTHFAVSAPASATAGTAFNFTVTALDQFNNTATGYTGTVSLSTTDPLGTVTPTTCTFLAGDHGTKTFTNRATPPKVGTWQITANDSVNSFSGSRSVVVNPAAAASLAVDQFPASTTAGVAHDVRVTAFDPFGNIATGYTGTVSLSTTDPLGTLTTTTYTFLPGDSGAKTFTNAATLRKARLWDITATDPGNGSNAAESNIQAVPAAPPDFAVTRFPASATAGTARAVPLTPSDPFGNRATDYTGTVNLSTTDPLGTVTPTTYTFLAGD